MTADQVFGVIALFVLGFAFGWSYLTFLLAIGGVEWARKTYPWRWLDGR